MLDLLVHSWFPILCSLGLIILLIVRDVLVNALSRQVERLKLDQLFPIPRYIDSLKERLAEMPFLFRDMRLSARDDYVETIVSTASTKAEALGSYADYRSPSQRFKEARRAVLFGDGGYGKTTLFRHLVLRMINGDSSGRTFERRLVPIFVSLKTVSLSSEYPVLEALQACDPLFTGDAGYRRLRKLAKQHRLAIFLDGYDEVPYAGGLDYLIRELETLFGTYDSRRPNFFEQHKDFYIFVKECRVYLSSRREFFFHYPVRLASGTPHLLVRGLGDRRAELLERVFSRYVSNEYLASRLSHELFLQQLAETCDGHLQELSYSPLFLTVMAYVYVEAVKDPDRDGRVVFSGGAPDLIKQCISLLLTDIDEYKARGLNEVQREALMNRRAAFSEEKIGFLKNFAAQLYETNISIFSREVLIDSARRYFSTAQNDSSRILLRGLDSDDPTINIVDQLIFSGLFVVVDARGGDGRLYDFPHRRFRETLAVAYYDNPKGAEHIARRFDDPAYGELALVYVEQSYFSERVLNGVLDRFTDGSGYKQMHGEFLVHALGRVSGDLKESTVRKFFELLAAHPDAKAPRNLTKHLPQHELYLVHLLGKINDLMIADSGEIDLRLACLADLFPNDVEEVMRKAIDSSNHRVLRRFLFAPITIPLDLRRQMINGFLTRTFDRSGLIVALFDIYRSCFSGKTVQEKAIVHEVLRGHMSIVAELLFGRDLQSTVVLAAIDHAFGGSIHQVEGIPLLEIKETAVAAPYHQLY